MQDLITLYKDGQSKRVWAVDANPFLDRGWSTQPPTPALSAPAPIDFNMPKATAVPALAESQPEPPPLAANIRYQQRRAELDNVFKTEGWKRIAEIAGELKILKPSGGWAEAIPLILTAEGLKA